jgi:transcriptional regulator with GAF, ATPase, and Fis domain
MMDETLDPTATQTLQSIFDQQQAAPTLVIAYHSDLSRVGDRHTLRIRGRDATAIGRASPDFDGTPIADPCVSRNQLSVGWDTYKTAFILHKDPNARRPVRVVYPEQYEVGTEPVLLEPGTLIAIGDRVMLLLQTLPPHVPDFESQIGFSSAIQATRQAVRQLAHLDTNVLISGEPGVGKEVIAKLLHQISRPGRPFLAVNCASLPESLIEQELFGHTRGAFTGAGEPKPGLFRAANTGSLLLDEIGEMPLALQAKLLRVLQEKKVRPVGGTIELPIDTRVIAATNRDLAAAAEDGIFRSDLYSRLEAPFIDVPTLRERRVDIPFLFAHFLIQRAKETPSVGRFIQPANEHTGPVRMAFVERLIRHSWPRNVREVQKCVDAAIVASTESKRLQLPDWRWSDATDDRAVAQAPERKAPLSEIDEARLLAVLQRHDFVARRAAGELQISRTSLDKRMRELGIPRPSDLTSDAIRQALQENDGDPARAATALRVSTRGLKQQMRLLGDPK